MLDPRIHPVRPDLAAKRYQGLAEAEQFVDGEVLQANGSRIPVLNKPSHDAMMISELLYGETFEVFEQHEGWAWGQARRDGYVGYISSGELITPDKAQTHLVCVPSSHLYPKPNLKSRPTRSIFMGSPVTAKGAPPTNGFIELADGSWIYDRHVIDITEVLPDYVTTAMTFLGTPYLWGGKTHVGMDCSGLVQILFNMAGTNMPRDTDMQLEALKSSLLPPDQLLQRGDIAFFPGHVGIMLDAERLLHANATHMAVAIDTLSDVIEIVGKTEKSPYTGACRPVEPCVT